MRSVPFRPGRCNWIWLASGGLTVAVVVLAALRLPGPACVARHPAGRLAVASPAWPAQPAVRSRPPAAPALSTGSRPGLPGPLYSGQALFYDPGSAVGSCTLGPFPARGWFAAVSPRQFAGGHACGTYLVVHGPAGTVRAEVVDLCPACHSRTVNLSRSAYGRIGNPRPGTAPVTYQWLADPPLRNPLALRASAPGPDEVAVQILGHGNRLASVAITRAPAGPAFPAWHLLRLEPDDFWVAHGMTGPGPFTLRITDVLGHQVILPQVMLLPGTLTRTGIWMYQPARAAPASQVPARALSRGTAPARGRPARAAAASCPA